MPICILKQFFVLLNEVNEREVYFNARCNIWLKRYMGEREDDEEALYVRISSSPRMSIA